MTDLYTFAPSTTSAFQFQPTLDGELYTAVVQWNVAGQRYYLGIYTLRGERVCTVPLIGSQVGLTLERLVWAEDVVTVTTAAPHGYAVGRVLPLTVAGTNPDGYNGTFAVTVQAPLLLTYPLDIDPGPATKPGVLQYDISLVGGYFNSKIVWRSATGQFEVSP